MVGAGAIATALTREALVLAEESDAAESPGWIDAHVHVWHPDTTKYPISTNFDRADMRPPSFTAEELFSHSKPAGVSRIVLIQMSFYEYDHTYMCEVMDRHPGVFSGVALIDHRADDVVMQADALKEKGMRGFRLHSRGDAKDWVNHPNMHALWRKAADDGLAVCPLINPAEIPYVDLLCERFPDTRVVIDHFARIGVSGTIEESDLDALCGLARWKNTFVKTSAFYALGKKSPPYDDLSVMIRRTVDAFSPQRLMWATDCPYQVQGEHSYEASISLVRDRLDFLSEADKTWMLRDTADRVFFA
tara:strand:- start:474967 stop:475878 length:912 start_codon:yes stop_codon:yes gene_type:complete